MLYILCRTLKGVVVDGVLGIVLLAVYGLAAIGVFYVLKVKVLKVIKKPKIYGANKIHRLYIESLYEKINSELAKKSKKESLSYVLNIEKIEQEARREHERYKDIASFIISSLEKALDKKLPYQDRAAVIIRQAEYEFDRPFFRKERGRILLNEYEKDYGEVAYENYHVSSLFAATYKKHRYLVPVNGRYKAIEKKDVRPSFFVGRSRDKYYYVASFITRRIPPIWTIVSGMGALPGGGVFFDSETSPIISSSCEFPPGVTIKEMEKVFVRADEEAEEFEQSVQKLLEGARRHREDAAKHLKKKREN